MTYDQAIDRSVSHNEIVFLDHDVTTMDQLAAACEGCVVANESTEYWGAREDGEEWRVHVRHDDDGQS